MSDEQFNRYKEIKKELSVKQLAVRQRKIDKATKLGELRMIEEVFDTELRKILSPQQYERWKRNDQMKQARSKKY